MNGTVICGVDASGSARGAIRIARELADRYGLALLYVHVADRPGSELRALELLRATSAAAGDELVVERGHPADRLVALAEERLASFVVVGNNGPRSSLLGSISADVARRSPCPVVIVPPHLASTRDDVAASLVGTAA